MPCRFDQARQRSAANAPSWTRSRSWASGPCPRRAPPACPGPAAGRHPATVSRRPSASTSATRSRPTVRLVGSYPRGPRMPIHFTIWVPATPKAVLAPAGPAPAARHPRGVASSRPRSSQRRNRPYLVGHGGPPAGRLLQAPPASATRSRRPRAGAASRVGLAAGRPTQPAAISSTALRPTPFRRGSVHDGPSPFASMTERLVPSRGAQTGTARRSRLETGSQPTASARSASSRITAAA